MTDHKEIRELIPWFVNGTLNESEQSLLDAHVRECDECRREVEDLVRLSSKFGWPQEVIELQDSGRAAAADFVEALPETGAAGARPAWAVPVLVTICVAVAATLTTMIPPQDEFRTRSTKPGVVVAAPVVQVVFQERATEKAIRETLLAGGNVVLSGPSTLGVYRVAVTSGESDAYIARLERNPDVIFAEEEMTQ